jgi:hypothetical protein
MEVADDATSIIQGVGLDRLDLSTRTANCCERANVMTLGDLSALHSLDVMKWRSAGRKTLREIREVLGKVGLKLRDDCSPAGIINPQILTELSLPVPTIEPPPSQDVSLLLKTATQDQQKSLVIPIKKLLLSVRAQNVVSRSGAKYLGDIAQLSKGDILSISNSGVRTLGELEKLLASHGLQLGTVIPDWSSSLVAAISKQLKAEIAKSAKERSNRLLAAIDPAPGSLEAELSRIVRAFENERNSDALIKLWGWAGNEPRVLDSVGQEFNLTRERVRQIEARSLRRYSACQFDLPFLRSAIDCIRTCVPMRDTAISERLYLEKVSKNQFSVWGLKKAVEIFEMRWPFETLSCKGIRMLMARGEGHRFRRALIELRRKTSDRGLTNIATLTTEAGLEESRSSALRLFLETVADVAWLDDGKEWLFLPEVPRNRLFNLCSKVLSVCPEIRIAELRRAVGKSRRLAMVPPQRTLAAFVEQAGLATVLEDRVRVGPNAVKSLSDGSVEATMLKVLDAHGPVMDGEQFARRCVEAGLNSTSFYIYRLISPVIGSLGKGVYCKVGAEVAPGTVEDIVARRNLTPRISDHGWTSTGRLWFGTQLSVATIAMGGIRLMSFVSDLTQGDWEVVLPDQTTCGSVSCKGIYIFNFRRALALLGAEPMDLVAVEFDLSRGQVHVRVGGPELFEKIEDPESVNFDNTSDDDD